MYHIMHTGLKLKVIKTVQKERKLQVLIYSFNRHFYLKYLTILLLL